MTITRRPRHVLEYGQRLTHQVCLVIGVTLPFGRAYADWFSVDFASQATPQVNTSDILESDDGIPNPAVDTTKAQLGITTINPSYELNAFSIDRVLPGSDSVPIITDVYFSLRNPTSPVPDGGNGANGDVFRSGVGTGFTQLHRDATQLDLNPFDADNVDAFDLDGPPFGIPDIVQGERVFFSLNQPSATFQPSDILTSQRSGPGIMPQPSVFRSAGQLNLENSDDIDGLVVATCDPDNVTSQTAILFSLSANSPTVGTRDRNDRVIGPGDILTPDRDPGYHSPLVLIPAAQQGLSASDEMDALDVDMQIVGPDHPLLPNFPRIPWNAPGVPAGFRELNAFVFDPFLNTGCDNTFFFDPPAVEGYVFQSYGTDFSSVTLPSLPGDSVFQLWYEGLPAAIEVQAGQETFFPADGVGYFVVTGIDPNLELHPDDELAFVTGVTFTGPGLVELFQTPLISGDFNRDGVYDGADVDALVAEIAAATHATRFDVTGDNLVNADDLTEWLAMAGEVNLPGGGVFLPGDANLDGVVDGQDFVIWNTHKFTSLSSWTGGDFTADGVIDGQDFVVWNDHKFMAADVAGAVPEPVGLLWFSGLGLIGIANRGRTAVD